MESTAGHTPNAKALFKNMLRGSSLYMVANATPSLIGLALIPIITKHISRTDYGVLDLLQQIGAVVSVLLGQRFSAALGYFYNKPEADKPRVVGTTLFGALGLGLVATALCWVAATPLSRYFFNSEDYAFYLRLMFVGLPLGFLLDAGLGWLRIEDRAVLFTQLSIFRLVFSAAGTALLVSLGYGVAGVVGANAFGGTIAGIIMAIIAFRSCGFAMDRALFVSLLRFAVPSTISGLALFIIHFSDRFVLARYVPLDQLGLYAISYKLALLLNPLQTAFEGYWAAQIYTIVRREDAQVVLARTYTYITLLMSFAALGVLFFAKPALHFLTTPEYLPAISLVPVVLAAYYLRSLGDFFRYIFHAHGLLSRDAICNGITAGVALAAYFVLIPRYGAPGAAWATVLTFVVSSTISIVWSYYTWPYRLEGSRLVKLGTLTLLLVLAHFALPETPLLAVEIIERLGLLVLFPLLLWFSGFVSPGEQLILQSLRSRILAFRF